MARRNRPCPRGATLRRKVYTGPGVYDRTEGTPEWSPLPPRHRCRLYETGLFLKGALPKRKGSQGAVTATAMLVLHALVFQFANAKNGVCLPATATIAGQCGVSEASVERALIVWREVGMVRVHRRHNVYRIGRGHNPGQRRQRGTEIRIETSNGYTFAPPGWLDDITHHLGRIVRRLARLGARRGRRFDALTTPCSKGTTGDGLGNGADVSPEEKKRAREKRRQAVVERWLEAMRRLRGDYEKGEERRQQEQADASARRQLALLAIDAAAKAARPAPAGGPSGPAKETPDEQDAREARGAEAEDRLRTEGGVPQPPTEDPVATARAALARIAADRAAKVAARLAEERLVLQRRGKR